MFKEVLKEKWIRWMVGTIALVAWLAYLGSHNSNYKVTDGTTQDVSSSDANVDQPIPTVELELKDWYTSYSDTFNLKGKCTPEAKVEIYPVKKRYPVKWENPTQTSYSDASGNFSFSIDTSKTVSFYVKVTKEGMQENHQPVSIDREYH